MSGTAKRGANVRPATIAKWAGVPGGRVTLTALTKRTCTSGAKGVTMRKAGVCKVRVASGGRSAIATIAVR